jgi:hypothetical protein
MPSASVAPPLPKSPSVAGVPATSLLSGESKKETAKVPPSAAGSKSGLPQASVALQRKPGGSSSTSTAAVTVTPQAESEGRVGLMLGVLAIAASLVAVGVQVLMFL